MRDSLIITLIEHPVFGYLLQPAFASFCPETDVYTITEMAFIDTKNFEGLTDDEQAIAELAMRYSDRELMKSFSREKSEVDFLQKVTPENVETHIRPFIEKKQAKIAEIVRRTNTPFFWREKIQDRDFRSYQILEILKEPSHMVFRFRQAETFTYTVSVQNGISDVELFEQFFAPLASNPAIAVIGSQLHYFNDVDEKKLRPFFTKQAIEVPARSVNQYIRSFVVQCVKNYTVKAEGIDVFEQKYNPVAELTLENGFDLKPLLTLRFHYGNHRFAFDRPYIKEVEVVDENGVLSIGWFYRDREWERECEETLLTNGLSKSPTGQFYMAYANSADAGAEQEIDGYGLIEWMNRNRELLKRFVLKQSLGELVYFTGEVGLEVDAAKDNDWFDMGITTRFGEIEIPFIHFKEHILHNIREYVLPDGRIAILPAEWFARFSEIFRFGRVWGDKIRLPAFHFRVKELAENGRFSDEIAGDKQSPVEIPAALNATLRPYQVTGFRWLAYLQQNSFGGCLADDMGLGKTLQTIALLLQVYTGTQATTASVGLSSQTETQERGSRQLSLFEDLTDNVRENGAVEVNRSLPPTLIVMPTSLVHNWRNELMKFAPILSVYVHTGVSRFQNDHFKRAADKVQIILTSYGTVRQDVDFLREYGFHYLILDESQYIKNPASQIFECVKQLESAFKLTLTGTPIENSLSDLWSQMDFLNDGILGKHREFRARFNEAGVINDGDSRDKLLKIIDPFILRRTKEEVEPELPPLTEETIYCEMEEEQAMFYNEEKSKIRNALLEQLDGNDKPLGVAALSSLMRLRLLANHPAISIPDYMGRSAKFDQIVEQTEIIFSGQHKVLIFSSFVKHLQLFADYFDRRGWQYAWLTGETTNREAQIEKFNASEDVRAFFISLKAGGTGLNLTTADYVFIIDPWWNPAAEMQAVSRAHRIGQDKKVTLYRFIVKGTVEEKMQRLQQYKTTLSDALIKPQLTMKEIQELLD